MMKISDKMNLDKSHKNFFRDKSVGFPKYKLKKTNYYSYTTNNQKGTVYIENGYIQLPKLKSMVIIKQHRKFNGIIKSFTISKIPSDRYYISILVDIEIQQSESFDKKIGIDLGLKEFAIYSDGFRVDNTKHFRKSEKRFIKKSKRK